MSIGREMRGIPDSKKTTDINTTDKESIDSEESIILKERGIMGRFIEK